MLLDRSLEAIGDLPRLGFSGYGITDVQIHALLGNKPKALVALRNTIDAGWRGDWWYDLQYDFVLRSLHGDSEFQAMVQEV